MTITQRSMANLAIKQQKKFQDIDEFQEKIDDYFNTMDTLQRPYTVEGLAVHLKTSKVVLHNIICKNSYSDDFKAALGLARQRIEADLVEGMLTGDRAQAGSIFALKNGYDWVDRREQRVTTNNNTDDLQARRLRVVNQQGEIETKQPRIHFDEVPDND